MKACYYTIALLCHFTVSFPSLPVSSTHSTQHGRIFLYWKMWKNTTSYESTELLNYIERWFFFRGKTPLLFPQEIICHLYHFISLLHAQPESVRIGFRRRSTAVNNRVCSIYSLKWTIKEPLVYITLPYRSLTRAIMASQFPYCATCALFYRPVSGFLKGGPLLPILSELQSYCPKDLSVLQRLDATNMSR